MEDNSVVGFSLTLEVPVVTMGRDSYPENTSNLLMSCTPTSDHFYAGTDKDAPACVEVHCKGFLNQIILSTYQPSVDILQLLPEGT